MAELYRCRWQIEAFFKQIKQTLQLADFLGHSANAVQWQVWMALLVYVLLRFQAWLSHWAHSLSRTAHALAGGALAPPRPRAIASRLWDSRRAFCLHRSTVPEVAARFFDLTHGTAPERSPCSHRPTKLKSCIACARARRRPHSTPQPNRCVPMALWGGCGHRHREIQPRSSVRFLRARRARLHQAEASFGVSDPMRMNNSSSQYSNSRNFTGGNRGNGGERNIPDSLFPPIRLV